MSFSLIVITPEKDSLREMETICTLFEIGLKLLHLRKPTYTKNEVREYLQKIPNQFHKRIVLHDHYELIEEFDLKGAHLTEKTKQSVRKMNALKKTKTKIISTSCHNYKDILKSRRKYEYIFLSPVFDSISKQGYKSNFDLENLKLFLKKRKNIVALGGINIENIKTIKQLGFSGAAVLGSIWESKEPVKNCQEFILKIK